MQPSKVLAAHTPFSWSSRCRLEPHRGWLMVRASRPSSLARVSSSCNLPVRRFAHSTNFADGERAELADSGKCSPGGLFQLPGRLWLS